MAKPAPEHSLLTAPDRWSHSPTPRFGKARSRGGTARSVPIEPNRRGLQVHTTLEPCGLHTAANPARSIIARISGILRIQRNGGLGSSPASQESRAHRTMASFVNPPPSHKHHLSAAYTYTLTHCARRHAPLRPTRSGPIDLIGRNLDRDEVTLRQPG